MNHFSSDLPQALWWTQPIMLQSPETPLSTNKALLSQPNILCNSNHPHLYHSLPTTTAVFPPQNTAFNLNLNHEEDNEQQSNEREKTLTKQEQEHQYYQPREISKEPMFEKPLTPSDVGKLNRLVIPKQYAEKFFPLSGNSTTDSVDKGLLLSFEDELGKTWRFRYSYWNSSQSYVLTKGWSRFVKEKRLDAGDILVFERHKVLEGSRDFIGWRKRSGVAPPVGLVANGGRGGGCSRGLYCGQPYRLQHNGPYLTYQPEYLHAGSVMQNHQIPSGNSKKLRLFGVNLECQSHDSEPPTPDGSSMSSHGEAHYQYYNPKVLQSNHHKQEQNTKFSADVHQMRYRQG